MRRPRKKEAMNTATATATKPDADCYARAISRLVDAARDATYFSGRDARSGAHGEDVREAHASLARAYKAAFRFGVSDADLTAAMRRGRDAGLAELRGRAA
jgi:hypothetical protein